ncbi:MAG: septum formation initiator family protein [Deltaproteobacteria bacterium]|nr:septum formation initiator family protein [Deltaproteobacteria bacterium]
MFSRIRTIPPFFLQIVRSLPLRSWLVIFGAGLFLWFWIFGHNGLVDLEHLIRLQRNYTQQKQSLAEEKEQLEQDLKNMENPRYLKHLIHQELGYVESDEVVIQFQEKK